MGNGAFYNCTNLKNVIMNNNIKVLRNGTFYNCTSLENIILSNSMIEI